MDILLPLIYFMGFVAILYKARFFDGPVLSRKSSVLLFTLKVLAGIAFYLVYTNYYQYRNTSDAFKYFEDGSVLFNALKDHPLHYFQMLTGIGSEKHYLYKYYQEMNYWFSGSGGGFNDSRTIIRFNAFVFIFSLGNFYVHILFMCFLSTTGLVALFKAFMLFSPGRRAEWIFCVFLIPSVLFWSSGVLKEGMLVFGLGCFTYCFARFLFSEKRAWLHAIGMLLFGFVLLVSKVYVLFALIPGIALLLFLRYSQSKVRLALVAAGILVAGGITAYVIKQHPRLDPLQTIVKKQSDFINLANGGTYFRINDYKGDTIFLKYGDEGQIMPTTDPKNYQLRANTEYYTWYKGRIIDTLHTEARDTLTYRLLAQFNKTGSRIEIRKLEPTFASLLQNAPFALFNGIFRPTFRDSSNAFMWLCALENCMLLLVMLLAIVFFNRPSGSEWLLFFFGLSFTLVLAALIGYTTPVLGALVRYKVPFLPFLFACFFLLVKPAAMRPIRWLNNLFP